MKYLSTIIFAVTVAFLFGACTHLGPSSRPFVSGLCAGESIVVNFRSQGCFQSSHFELILTAADGDVSVSGVDLSAYWDEQKKKIIENSRRVLRSVRLSERDALRLDCLFEFYRGTNNGGCTTVDKISVSRNSSAGAVTSEHFTDASCATYDRRDLLTIPELVRRMTPKR